MEIEKQIKIEELLTETPVKEDPVYRKLDLGDPLSGTTGYYLYVKKNKTKIKKITSAIKFVFPPKFEAPKKYEKIVVEIGCGLPYYRYTPIFQFKEFKKHEELKEIIENILNGSYLYVGIEASIKDRKTYNKVLEKISKDKDFQRGNIAIIEAHLTHLIPFIKSDSVDILVNYSGGDVPINFTWPGEWLEASYARILKLNGKYFADNFADAPKRSFFKHNILDKERFRELARRSEPLDIVKGFFIPDKDFYNKFIKEAMY